MKLCARCEERGQTWSGSVPKCAFPSWYDGFQTDNWNCATMNALRNIAEGVTAEAPHCNDEPHRFYGDDHSIAVIPFNIEKYIIDQDDWLGEWEGFLLLGWYKNRGRTDQAILFSYSGVEKLTYKMADIVIRSYEVK